MNLTTALDHIAPEILRLFQLSLAFDAIFLQDSLPLASRHNHIAQVLVSTKPFEHVQIAHPRALHAGIGDAVEVDYSVEFDGVGIGSCQP
jgi:hypothetical protein